MNTTPNTTRPVSFIRFHGLTLLVVENDGIEYVDPRPLCELAGMQWKGARRTLLSVENAKLYGTNEIPRPEIAGFGTNSCPENAVHIRLDRARMFLARINTAQMKSHGNVDAAEELLALQIEWAEALHNYETGGTATKRSNSEAHSKLIGLIKARAATTNAAERMAITAMVRDLCEAMGYPLPADTQPTQTKD